MENQHHLPDEIRINILSRLPADSIIRFKRVCKAWRSIIEEDPVFHDMHVRRLIDDNSSTASSSLDFVVLQSVWQTSPSYLMNHYVLFAEYKHTQEVMNNFKRWRLPIRDDSPIVHKNLNLLAIVGSCNGLICISTPHGYQQTNHHHTYVCNPWTGEVLDLSDSLGNDHNVIRVESSLILVGIGFGYLPSSTTTKYKVVRIYGDKRRRSIKHVQVYTLGSRREEGDGRWRSINVPVPISSSSSWSDDISFSSTRDEPVFGVSVNGSLYFNNYMNIVSFDLANEEFRIIVPPAAAAPADSTSTDIDGLGVLGGYLCATKSRPFINPIPIHAANPMITDLWVMEKKDNNKDDDQEESSSSSSWIKKFSLPPERYMMSSYGYIPLGALASPPRILLLLKCQRRIVSYNPQPDGSYCMNNIPGYWNTSSNNTLISYVKSCVSLKALGETTTKKVNLRSGQKKEDHGSDYAACLKACQRIFSE